MFNNMDVNEDMVVDLDNESAVISLMVSKHEAYSKVDPLFRLAMRLINDHFTMDGTSKNPNKLAIEKDEAYLVKLANTIVFELVPNIGRGPEKISQISIGLGILKSTKTFRKMVEGQLGFYVMLAHLMKENKDLVSILVDLSDLKIAKMPSSDLDDEYVQDYIECAPEAITDVLKEYVNASDRRADLDYRIWAMMVDTLEDLVEDILGDEVNGSDDDTYDEDSEDEFYEEEDGLGIYSEDHDPSLGI